MIIPLTVVAFVGISEGIDGMRLISSKLNSRPLEHTHLFRYNIVP